ncbi:MAG: hypothetical protein RBU23_03250 [Candidatus Auribacterota bacterium]|jgi:hypothetical protein|nr:hypothetical protein [Candidatus Auribacterota bacterium]
MWWNRPRKTSFLIIGLTALAIIASVHTASAQDVPMRTIDAEGIAAVTADTPEAVLNARDEAVKRALRRAIEQGVGALIDSESMAQNFQLLNDQIYSHVKGYVSEYDIIADNGGADGIYRITVRATVVLAQLRKDLKALNIIKHEKGNPRIMVLFTEVMDGMPISGAVAASKMEQVFLKHGFPLVDKAQMMAIQERDATLNYADPQKASALGRQFGAEVVIIGQASADLVDSSQPYGVSVFYYQAQISARAIKVDTATVMTSESVQSDWRKPGQGQGSGRMEAAKDALAAAGQMAADAMINQILERWRSEVYNTVMVQVVAQEVTGLRRKALLNELKSIRGVESVNERSFINKVLIIDVEVEGSIWNTFSDRLEQFETVGVTLTGKTQNRIDIELFDLQQ